MNCLHCEYFEQIPSQLFTTKYPYCNYHDMDLTEGPNDVNPRFYVCQNFMEITDNDPVDDSCYYLV
jgi:hypothetical protein